jgi:predicted nuclease with TOPRIM domain
MKIEINGIEYPSKAAAIRAGVYSYMDDPEFRAKKNKYMKEYMYKMYNENEEYRNTKREKMKNYQRGRDRKVKKETEG